MRGRRLKKLWQCLQALQGQKLTRDQLLMKLGAAKNEETGRSRFLFVCRLSASNHGADSSTMLLSTGPVSSDVALAVFLTEADGGATSAAVMV